MHGRRLLLMSLLIAIAACDGGSATTTTLGTTTTPHVGTTTTFHNPFLDTSEEPSNFSPGDVVDVVGLSADEQNWVGSFPANDVEFFGRLWEFERIDAGLTASGEAASYLGGPVWERVAKDGMEDGYFPQENIGIIGRTEDVTSEVGHLTSDSIDDLLGSVALALAGGVLDPIQIVKREFGGRELYYDLIGPIDDSIRGYRVKVVAVEDGDLFRVASVERSLICVRETDESGACT